MKWPCSYCPYPRVAQAPGQVTCVENEKWK